MTKSKENKKAMLNHQKALLVYPPAIPFTKVSSKKNTEFKESKENFKTIEID